MLIRHSDLGGHLGRCPAKMPSVGSQRTREAWDAETSALKCRVRRGHGPDPGGSEAGPRDSARMRIVL